MAGVRNDGVFLGISPNGLSTFDAYHQRILGADLVGTLTSQSPLLSADCGWAVACWHVQSPASAANLQRPSWISIVRVHNPAPVDQPGKSQVCSKLPIADHGCVRALKVHFPVCGLVLQEMSPFPSISLAEWLDIGTGERLDRLQISAYVSHTRFPTGCLCFW